MAEQTCPRCAGSGATERSHYETVTDPDGKPRPIERHTVEPCSLCGGNGKVNS